VDPENRRFIEDVLCFAARRRYQRAARITDADLATVHQAEYRKLRNQLRMAIWKAQEAVWTALCREVDNDLWCFPYRVVTKKLSRIPPGIEARGKDEEIANYLFPNLPPTD
jgi:hypothetical protein